MAEAAAPTSRGARATAAAQLGPPDSIRRREPACSDARHPPSKLAALFISEIALVSLIAPCRCARGAESCPANRHAPIIIRQPGIRTERGNRTAEADDVWPSDRRPLAVGRPGRWDNKRQHFLHLFTSLQSTPSVRLLRPTGRSAVSCSLFVFPTG